MPVIRKYYYEFLVLFAISLLGGCSAPYPRFTSEDNEKKMKEEKNEDDVIVENRIESIKKEEQNPGFNDRKMQDAINKRVGIPYHFGGKDESGFDCSGFTAYIYEKSVNLRLPPSSVDQYKTGQKIDRGELIFGDLVFFNTTGRIPSHVGIYVGDSRFAHASVQNGVTISSLNSAYYKKRFVGARRLIFR
jgi:cell wall-associated NlpC family hydrolase